MVDGMLEILVTLAIGLTLLGCFSRFKIFALIAVGPILAILYEIATSEFTGAMVVATTLSAWLLFNLYVAFSVQANE